MPEMNRPSANIGSTNYNPVAALSRGLDRGAQKVSAVGASRFQVRAAIHMQGQQHEHEKFMQTGQHEHERGLALIGGAVDIEKAKIEGRAQVHVARAQGASQVDIAKVQADSALKQQAATQRHEVRLGVQQHNQELEKAATEHHLATGLVDTIVRNAQEGTAINIKSAGGTHVGFTKAVPKVTKEQPAAPVAEAPKEEPAGKAESPLMINHPVHGGIVRQDSLTPKELAAAKAKAGKKNAPKKKAAPKKKK